MIVMICLMMSKWGQSKFYYFIVWGGKTFLYYTNKLKVSPETERDGKILKYKSISFNSCRSDRKKYNIYYI